ncbi:MAG TPA: hypothetical protein VM187_02200, partial [Niastella sp.]|nr:hypothetical protein [Niastella sp.]
AALAEWLDKTATNSIQEAGYTIPASTNPQRRTLQTMNIYGTYAKDKMGRQKNFFLLAYRRPDNTVRYARIMYPGNPKNANLNIAVDHFAALAKKEGATANTDKSVSSNNSNNKQKETTPRKQQTPVTAPGQGLKPAQIKGIVINAESGVGVGGMVTIEYRPYLLLQDGSVYRYPTVAPYDLDVAASKAAEPKKWGTWKLEGKIMSVTLPEKGVMKTERWDGDWFWAKAPVANEKIKGAYMTIGGGGNTAMGGNTMIVYSSNINFNEKGQFTMKKTGGGTNTDFDVSSSAYSNSNAAGTYKLNGYSIEMRYNNGQVVRKLFYFYPDSRTTFGIGDDAYVPD